MNFFRFALSSAFFSFVLLVSHVANSAEAVLAEVGPHSVAASDVQGEALRIDAANRKAALAKPEAVTQVAINLLVRRSLAAEAEAAGLGQDPTVQGALRVARDRVLSDALIARIEAESKPKPEVTDAVALATYKSNPKRFDLPQETGARHILIASATPDAAAKAAQILVDLRAGADFATLAREKSQDPGSAVQGGSLGFFSKGRMVAPFEAALDKLQKPGELSDVVETQFGYHIIKLEERRSAGVRPYEQVKEFLRREAEASLATEARMARVRRIQDLVKVNHPAIDEFAASNK